MADVWISRKRWTCKYCDVTINDDLPSRRHHESGLRHKQNVEKALQDLYRKGEQERKDAEQTRKEMARIEALAAESYAKDQALGHQSDLPSAIPSSSPATSALSSTSAQPKPVPGPSRQPTRSTGELKREATQSMAQAGEWESVEAAEPLQHASSTTTSLAGEISDRDKARSFRMKEKVARFDDSDDEESLSTIKIRKRPHPDASGGQDPPRLVQGVKKEEPAHVAGSMKVESDDPTESASDIRPDEDTNALASLNQVAKKEGGDEIKAPSAVKEEGDGGNGAGGGLFKKRRAGAGAGAKRVRAVN